MRKAIFLISIAVLPVLAHAQTTDAAQTLPVDSRKSWTAAFTAFTAQGLPPEEEYLAFSIPLLLRDQLSSITLHSFSDEEKLAWQKEAISRELNALYKSLSQLRQQRDETLFQATQDAKAAAAAEKKLSDALDRIRWLQALDPTLIVMEKEKPVVIKEGSGVGNLFEPPTYSQYQYAIQQDVDFLVGGTATGIQGYVLIDLWAYSATLQQIVYTFRDAAKPEEIYSSLAEAGKGLVGAMLGREWAAFTMLPTPPQCFITIDDTPMGEGKVQSAYLSPGTHKVEVTAPGYEPAVIMTTLTPFQDVTVPVSLKKIEFPTVSLSTNPPGAAVYLDSVWMGTTPLTLELPPVRSRLELDLNGYYSVPLSLGPDSPRELEISLQRDVASRAALQTKARDQFYVALGFFALSFPLPFFSYAYRNDYLIDQQRFVQDSQQYINAGNIAKAFTVGTWGGAAVSVGLFTWTLIDLIRYIRIVNSSEG